MLLDKLTDKRLPLEQRVDIRLEVKHLTLSDWVLIARAFDAWPFAPEVRQPTYYSTKSSTNSLPTRTGLEHRPFRIPLRTVIGLMPIEVMHCKCVGGLKHYGVHEDSIYTRSLSWQILHREDFVPSRVGTEAIQ